MQSGVMQSEDRQALQCLYDALDQFKGIALHMPVGQAMSFLAIALHEGKTLTEMARLSDMQLSTMSRQVIDLGDRNRRMEDGYKLIERRQNPMNLRENQYSLSPRGGQLIKALLKAMRPRGKA